MTIMMVMTTDIVSLGRFLQLRIRLANMITPSVSRQDLKTMRDVGLTWLDRRSSFESQDHGISNTASFSSGSAGGTSSSYYPQSSDHESNDDYELQQALKLSRDELLGNNRVGSSSSSGGQYDPGSIYPGTYELSE